jgi:Mrp family chromosome partitioning ATPase/capsular polysaccharide biosynthesis protein
MDANRPISVDTPESKGVDPLGLARRHWWLVLVLVALGVLGAAQFTRMEPKVYESSTSVLVQPSGTDTNVVGGRTKGDINLDTEAQLVRSTAVATAAGKLLKTTDSPDALAVNVTVEVPANTSVLVITYAAPTAQAARDGSHAFATSYLQNRDESARADLAGQIGTLNAKLTQLNAQLAQVNRMLAPLKNSDPNRANLENQRSTISAQIDSLTGRVNQLTTTTLSAGRIIRDAELPARPTKPNQPLNLASGAMVGLVLAIAAAFLRDRLDTRVRGANDIPRRIDLAVLAAVPARIRPRLDDVFAPFGTGGRIFNRLRNEILASVPAPAGVDARAALCGQIVVVTGASRGAASTVVATNLAAAFARTSAETVLVSAHLPDSIVETASLTRMLGVHSIPGLSDVLAGRFSLSTATQRAPRHPNLSVITTGGTASAGGLLQSQSLRDTLAMLRERAAYIVVEAPSTATSADAQSLASLADAAIVAVELRRTTYTEVRDAADQLRRVGTPLLGAVVLPRLAAARMGDEPVTEPAIPSDMLAVLEAIGESGASNDETIVTTRIRTSHPATPTLPRRRPKVGPPPKTVPLVIERTGDRKIVERSVAERLLAEHKPESPKEANEPDEAVTTNAEETTDSPAEQR